MNFWKIDWLKFIGIINYCINPLHTTDLFWYPLKTSENLWFSDVFRGYKERSVGWNGLILAFTDWRISRYCVNSVQIPSFFWSVFSRIWTEYGPEKTPYLDTFHAARYLDINPGDLELCVCNGNNNLVLYQWEHDYGLDITSFSVLSFVELLFFVVVLFIFVFRSDFCMV